MVRDISLRKEVEQQQHSQYQITQIKLAIAKALSQPTSLKHKYEKAIEALLAFDFLSCHKKAAVFLVEKKSATLKLFAYQGKFKKNESDDEKVAWLAIRNKEVSIADSSQQQSMTGQKHGYYLVPLARQDAETSVIFGTLLLYTKHHLLQPTNIWSCYRK